MGDIRRKKICFIASDPSGIISFHKTNFEKLSKKFDIYVVANFNDAGVFKDLNMVDSYSVLIDRRPTIASDLKGIWQLYKYFRQMKFDAFVSMSSNASLMSSIAGFFARIPIRIRIFTGQIWANKKGIVRLFFKFIDKLTVLLNTNILVDGKPQLEYLRENHILKKNQGYVLANGSICGVDINKFIPNESIRISEREKYAISEDMVVFTFLGRIREEKGIYELLSACNQLVMKYANCCLCLIGNSEGINDSVLSEYPNLVINKNIIFYGFTQKPYDSLLISDVFCLPSYREGFGMSAIEAASCGLPVICSDIYGLRDTFIHNETGLQCKVRDVDSLMNCMKYYCENKTERINHGLNGRKRVVEMFDKELVSNSWLEYLENVINKL